LIAIVGADEVIWANGTDFHVFRLCAVRKIEREN